MIQFIIGGLAGLLLGTALTKDGKSESKKSESKPSESKPSEPKNKNEVYNNSLIEIKAYIQKEGSESIVGLMTDDDYKNVPKFKQIGEDYMKAYNKLNSEIKKLPDDDNKEELLYRIDREGFDYTFNGYSYWHEIKSKPFQDARKEMVKQLKRVDAFVLNK